MNVIYTNSTYISDAFDIETTKIFVVYEKKINEISAANFFMFTFCRENKFHIGKSIKKFSVTTGFEELKKKVNKIS